MASAETIAPVTNFHYRLLPLPAAPSLRFPVVAYFVLSVSSRSAPLRNPFNPQSLISHLTNSNGCGNLCTKVLLTVSPFRPSFPPQPSVYSRNQRLLPSYAPRNANISSIFNILRILSVATGVSLLRHSPSIPLPSLRSLRPCLPRPARGGKSHVFSSLPPLEISLRSFSHSLPLFSTVCALFCKNTRGGDPDPVFGL